MNLLRESNFFAIVFRMRYIERWALMRNTQPENIAEHSLGVAMIAHALCEIGNVRYGRQLDADRAAVLGLYHDAPEIITGDLPTPVKYYSGRTQHAYAEVEDSAIDQLLASLPQDLRPTYQRLLRPAEEGEDPYVLRLVKAADKLSALLKCIEEDGSGNADFRSAEKTTRASLEAMAQDLPELRDFMAEFLPAYGSTLDELVGR